VPDKLLGGADEVCIESWFAAIAHSRLWHLADMPVAPADVRLLGVSSIGQCNTSCSLLAGVSKAKVFRGR
jgi:hypothetical protein